MAITKTTEIAQIEVVGEHKHVQVATDTVIKEDGTEISRSRHRHVVHAGTINDSDAWVDTDISGEAAEVQSICNAAWTNAVKTAYKDWLIANKSA
mgnify:CR=1 FL=1